jgi:hypothetical protein
MRLNPLRRTLVTHRTDQRLDDTLKLGYDSVMQTTKTFAVILLMGTALISCDAKPKATATPAPAAEAAAQGLQLTPQIYVAQLVSQGIQAINTVLAWDKALNDGVPGSNGNPAITADQLKDVLGHDNVEKIRAAAKIIRGDK